MNAGSRRADFFVLEAAEYIAEMSRAVAQREPADAERLVRGARALRGAALMAGLGTFARASASLEGIARAVRDHALAWDPHARAGWQEGLTTLQALVARAPNWEAGDDRQALVLSERLDRIASGHGPADPAPPAAAVLTPGVRAFIARESVLIAGSLEQAARALAPVPPPAALSAVLERMRALRGLGTSTDLSPLPELLDAMEVATRTLLADHPAPPDAAAVFADAAHALSAMARGVADHGRVSVPPGLDEVARRLLDSYATERDVVPIADLAPDGAESIARRGTPPSGSGDADPIPVEMVSVGDHLLLTADALARTGPSAARDLRLFVLHRTLSTMPARSDTARFLGPLTDTIRSAVARGMPTSKPDAFIALLRDCGRFLVDAGGDADRHGLLSRRDAMVASAGGAVPRAIDMPPPRASDDVVPIESLSPDDEPIVDIGDLAPDDDVVSIESLAPGGPQIPADAPGEPSTLERAFARRAAVAREAGPVAPSLEGLIGESIVDIADLIYRGEGARQRIDELRPQVAALLADDDATIAAVRPLLAELLDLLPLTRDAA